jgi:glycosyltransferase involved in cell wall biosynthesis
LPLLEAMSAGAASITSDVSSLPEVGGDGACYVDPTNVGGITAALAELLQSKAERRRLGEIARERARRFSWERTARETIDQLAALAPSNRS